MPVAEKVALLDELSDGSVRFGIGRGLSRYEAGFLEATAYGTPDQIIEKLSARRELVGDFEFAPAFRFGGLPPRSADRQHGAFCEQGASHAQDLERAIPSAHGNS